MTETTTGEAKDLNGSYMTVMFESLQDRELTTIIGMLSVLRSMSESSNFTHEQQKRIVDYVKQRIDQEPLK